MGTSKIWTVGIVKVDRVLISDIGVIVLILGIVGFVVALIFKQEGVMLATMVLVLGVIMISEQTKM